MKKSGIGVLLVTSFFWVLLFGCASAPPANNGRVAEAAAASNAAIAIMNGGNPAPSPGPTSAASGSVAVNSDKVQPAWVTSPGSVYNRNNFVYGVGSGNNRDQAEKNAFTALSSVFHQSLQADQTISTSYLEAVKNGASAGWTENTSVEGAIKTSTAIELVGA